MSIIKLYPEPNNKGTPFEFNPTGNATLANNGSKFIQFIDPKDIDPNDILDKQNPMKPFFIKSIENNTDYYVIGNGDEILEMFVGSINEIKYIRKLDDGSIVDQPFYLLRAIQKPQIVCETKNTENTDKKSNTYKITMIVFIVLFSFMFIGSLILFFTGMMKFHFSSVSFGHGTHY